MLLQASTFAIFGPDHLAALLVSTLIGGWVVRHGRQGGDRTRRHMRFGLAAMHLVNQLIWHGRKVAAGEWDPQDCLPLHLCDGAIIVTILALIRPHPLLIEVAYLWSLAGAFQACLTPDITEGFPSYPYWQFFITHSGLVISALFLVMACNERPRPGAWRRVFVATNAWAAIAAIANATFGGNYMFLDHPPPTGSLLDQFGPWPWYIVVSEVLALVSFGLLLLPFNREAHDRT